MGHNLISRRFAGLAGTLAAALLFCFSALPPAAAAPACIGADVVAEMRAGDVAAYRRLVDEGDGEINGTGKFWRLEKAGLAPSFLFGTMHATDDRATALPPQLRRAYRALRLRRHQGRPPIWPSGSPWPRRAFSSVDFTSYRSRGRRDRKPVRRSSPPPGPPLTFRRCSGLFLRRPRPHRHLRQREATDCCLRTRPMPCAV